MTLSDVAWSLVFLALLIVCMVGGMFAGAAYVTPAVLGSANVLPRQGFAKLVEVVGLFGGMAGGIGLALLVICLISRRFISLATHQRWTAQLENGAPALNPLGLKLSRFLMKYMQPRQRGNAL
jgi:Ni,Fe-hydrogenase I cytochrome b subunit